MSLTGKSLLDRVRDYLAAVSLREGESVLIGISGGPDSVALLSALSEFSLSPACAYVDHGIRPEEERREDGEFIRELCSRLSVPLFTRSIPTGRVEETARAAGRSTEDVARELRYALLEEMRLESGASYLALGHNLDDQFETMIMRFFMGAGPEGLKGIPEFSPRILRPLIRVPRETILSFLSEKGLNYRTDSTNLKEDYLRNRVRLSLIPEISRIFPGYGRALSSLREKMDGIDSYLKETSPLRWEKTSSGFRIAAGDYLALHPMQRLTSLYTLFDLWSGGTGERIPYRFLRPAAFLEVSEYPKKPASIESLPEGIILSGYGFSFEKRGDYFCWQKLVLDEKKRYLKLITGSGMTLPGIGVVDVKQAGPPADSGIVFFSDTVAPPLIMRSRRAGDEIQEASGTKPVKKLMSEWGVARADRFAIPVLEDRTGVIGIWGKPFGYQNRVSIAHQGAHRAESGKRMYFSLLRMEYRSGTSEQ